MKLRLFQRRPTFTAHNIELPDGSQTLPGEPLIGAEPVSESYLRTLRQFCPPPARVADLGCLEGGYAVAFARAGYEVLGIEGQEDNFATCEWVAERVELPNLRFVCDDVRKIGEYGKFDAVLCAGLLYHLDQPVSFLRELAEVTGRLLIISANYATEEGVESWWRARRSRRSWLSTRERWGAGTRSLGEPGARSATSARSGSSGEISCRR